jgi:tetrahydromethanopterin S-methyltransferase subunit G
MSDTDMTQEQFKQIMNRLEHIEKSMVTKTDIFQAVLTIQGLTLAVIVGTVVVLGATGTFQ